MGITLEKKLKVVLFNTKHKLEYKRSTSSWFKFTLDFFLN